MSDTRGWDEADRLRGVIRDICSAMDPSGRVTAENVEQKAEEMRREIERLESSELDLIRKAGEQATRDSLEIERLRDALANHKAMLAAAEAAGREVCDERDDARRLVTLERRVGRWMSTEDEEALRRLRQEAREWDGSKVDPPVRRTRHDRHCLIHDGVGCSREPGCEVEP